MLKVELDNKYIDKLSKELKDLESVMIGMADKIEHIKGKRLELDYQTLSKDDKVKLNNKIGDFDIVYSKYIRSCYDLADKFIMIKRIKEYADKYKLEKERETSKQSQREHLRVAREIIHHTLIDYILGGSNDFVSKDEIVNYAGRCIDTENYIYKLAFNILHKNIKNRNKIKDVRSIRFNDSQLERALEKHIKTNNINKMNKDFFKYEKAEAYLINCIKKNVGGYYE